MIYDEPGFTIENAQDVLRVEWLGRDARSNRWAKAFFVAFWAIWAPVTVVATAIFVASPENLVLGAWCVFGWLGTLGIPAALLASRGHEALIVNATSIQWISPGLFGPKKRQFEFLDFLEVSIGHYDDGSERECMVSLNLWVKSSRTKRRRRHVVAYFLATELKQRIFSSLRYHLAKLGRNDVSFVDYDA
jgi:hypothetical protein